MTIFPTSPPAPPEDIFTVGYTPHTQKDPAAQLRRIQLTRSEPEDPWGDVNRKKIAGLAPLARAVTLTWSCAE